MSGVLSFFGRAWWCPAGDLHVWSFDVWSQHNSQHLLDWYTPSHISHGLLFCLFFRWALSERLRGYAIVFSAALEASWEVLENSSFIINRYREATIALDYFGDSILNSVSDVAWCTFGFIIAARISTLHTIVIFLAMELLTLACIRDNLTLNVLMLIWPLDVIKEWQLVIAP